MKQKKLLGGVFVLVAAVSAAHFWPGPDDEAEAETCHDYAKWDFCEECAPE